MNQKKKPKQVGMMVYSMANFNFTWGLEMPRLVQREEPHMESGLVQICWAGLSTLSTQMKWPLLVCRQAWYLPIRVLTVL